MWFEHDYYPILHVLQELNKKDSLNFKSEDDLFLKFNDGHLSLCISVKQAYAVTVCDFLNRKELVRELWDLKIKEKNLTGSNSIEKLSLSQIDVEKKILEVSKKYKETGTEKDKVWLHAISKIDFENNRLIFVFDEVEHYLVKPITYGKKIGNTQECFLYRNIVTNTLKNTDDFIYTSNDLDEIVFTLKEKNRIVESIDKSSFNDKNLSDTRFKDYPEQHQKRNGINFYSLGSAATEIAKESYHDNKENFIASGFVDENIIGSLFDKSTAILMLKSDWINPIKEAVQSEKLEQFSSTFDLFPSGYYSEDGWFREDSLNKWLEDHVRNGIQINFNNKVVRKNEKQTTSNDDIQTTTNKINWEELRKKQGHLGLFLTHVLEQYYKESDDKSPTKPSFDSLRKWLIANNSKGVTGYIVKIDNSGFNISDSIRESYHQEKTIKRSLANILNKIN